jgi:hypothetical protein
MKKTRTLSMLCLSVLSMQLWGQSADTAAPAASGAATASTAGTEDLKQLRERVAQQEEEIKKLQESVAQQKALIEKAVQTQNVQAVPTPATNATATNAAASPGPVKYIPVTRQAGGGGAAQQGETKASPLAISIGNTTFAPLGFVDATFYARSTNVGSGIGTNFAGIPYGTAAAGHISETSFSTQNSRIGFRVDSTVLGSKVLGYFEADFLGNQPSNVFVTSNSNTFRMRNVFVDVQRNGFEILGGQDWSFATPNRKGLSPLPSDIFYTQVMDTNYQVGLPWSRQTQFRFIAHPTQDFAFGVSLENPQQYIGGSGGLNAAAVTLPTGLAAVVSQINNSATAAGTATGGGNYNVPNLHPDVIFKAAYDGHAGEKILHVEAGGMVRSFKLALPTTPFTTHSATAGAGFVNANLEVVKNFRLIANTFFGSGNGRYLFGTAPDFIVRPNGSISPIHSYSTVDGFELTVKKNTLIFGYYGGVYVKRNFALDADGKTLIGYGFNKSSANDNRTIQEGTFGITQTFWKNPNYGALSLINQYSYLWRNPWSVAAGAPKETHTNMFWVNLRYTLP